MAKVTAPLMSLDASGTVAKTAVFSKWKGRNYVRLHVTPMNPNTTSQKVVRSKAGTIAKAAHAVLTAKADVLKIGSEFYVAAKAAAIATQSWISSMQKRLFPVFAAVVAAYTALTTVKALYVTAAEGTSLVSYTDKSAATHTAGEQLYILAYYASTFLAYTGFTSGIDDATAPQLSAFVDYVNVSMS
jgi:hypothetical protein